MTKLASDIIVKDDRRKEVIDDLQDVVKKALEAVGLEASGDVTEEITNRGIVDTGLLGNSITFAVSGESPQISSYRADKPRKGSSTIESGMYTGSAPNDDIKAVYIGTNVEYAEYVEFGTSRMTARDFIKTPIRANLGHYKDILEEELENG